MSRLRTKSRSHSHSRSMSGLRLCQLCGSLYPRSSKWCLNCYDDHGQLLPVEVRLAAVPVVSAPAAPVSAVVVLTREIAQSGYFDNLREIAFGKRLGTFPADLAAACYWTSVNGYSNRYTDLEEQAQFYLRKLFGVEYEAQHG